MKKILCCAVSFLFLLSLAGCRFLLADPKPSDSQQMPSTQDNSGTTEGSQPSGQGPWEQVPMFAISLPTQEDAVAADDGTVLFRHLFQEVVLTTDDAAVTEAVTRDLLQRMDANVGSLNGLIEAAKSSYLPGTENWSAYYFEVRYAPARIDGAVLSLHGAERSYAGSGVPSDMRVSVNYDLCSGTMLTLADVLSEQDSAAGSLCQLLLTSLSETAEENALFDDYTDVISRRFQSDLHQDSTWFFTEEGLCFFFHPYDIAPYSSGTVYAVVPYSQLNGILADAYFPVEKPDAEGTLQCQWFDQADLNGFSHFSELILDSESSSILLHAEGVVFDVTLEQGHWDSKTNRFVSDSTVFAANCLAPGDGFVLQAPLSNTTPTLLLRCQANGREYSYYLLEDIQSGAAVLIAAN